MPQFECDFGEFRCAPFKTLPMYAMANEPEMAWAGGWTQEPELTCTPIDAKNVLLEWDSEYDVVEIYMGSLKIDEVTSGTSYTVSTVSPGELYTFFIRVEKDGIELESNEVTCETPIKIPEVNAKSTTSGIQVWWNNAGHSYQVQRSTDGGITYSLIIDGTENQSTVDEDVIDGNVYTYRVRSRNHDLSLVSGWSEAVSHQYDAQEDDPDQEPTATIEPIGFSYQTLPNPNECDGAITASWDNNDTVNEIRIQVERVDTAEAWTYDRLPGSTSQLVTDVCDGGEYRFRGRYFNSAGEGPWSDWSQTFTA